MIKATARKWILGMMLFVSNFAAGQYHVKPFEISKKITSIKSCENGMLYYGTNVGEFGIYDGVQFTKVDNFEANIHSIECEGSTKYLSTSKGVFEISNGSSEQISGNNLDVLARSTDNNFLVTSHGVFNKINQDYFPDKEEFYNINEIAYGDYFMLGDLECFRADEKIFIKKNRWHKVLDHSERDFSVLPWNDSKLVIADRKALVSLDMNGDRDTLLNFNVDSRNKLYRLSESRLLLCTDNVIGIFDLRKRSLNNFYSLSTDLISSVTVDKWDNIWIAAGSYLFQVIDQSNDKRLQPPEVVLKSISINGLEQEIKSSYRLNYEVNEVEIAFRGIHLTFPQNLEFQTFLSSKKSANTISADEEWSSPTKERKIEYRNLKPGKYTFQLRGTIDGQYFTYTKPIEFNIESDVFGSIWLIGIVATIAILLMALFFNFRYNSLRLKTEEDRKKLIQENKMLTFQQQALQLQMNPHFVFNALNSIQGLIAKEENQKARRYLQEFSAMMRSILDQSREKTILLSEEIKYLKSYLNLEQMANNESFDWQVMVDPEVEDDIRIPTMIIQPFVENAILHGVKSLKERRGSIELFVQMEGMKIVCRVKDNGIGRSAASMMKVSSHKSVAIDVVKERLRSKLSSMNESPIQYKDVMDNEGNVIGTEVLIRIPIMN
jgi:two-component sensor histidine kinase